MGAAFDEIKVVLTRPEGRSVELAEALGALGAEVTEVPLLEVVVAPDGGASLRAGLEQLDAGDWIALTSAAAIEGLCSARTPRELSSFRLAAVGEATADAARAHGLEPTLVGDGRGGGALAAQLPPPDREGAPILLALAAEPMAALGEGVVAAGYTPVLATAYATVPAVLEDTQVASLRAGEVLVLSSPKGVRLAAEVLGTARPGVVALGPTTAEAARVLGFDRLVVAESPGTAGVVAAFKVLAATA